MSPRKKSLTLLAIAFLSSCGGNGGTYFHGFHTRTTREYVEAGVPSPSRVWGLAQYARCSKALRKIAQDDFGGLPRLHDEKSKPIVQRMVARKNIDQLHKEATLNKANATDFVKVYQEILGLYFGNDEKADYYHQEIASLLIFLIDYADVSFDRIDRELAKKGLSPSPGINEALVPMIDGYSTEITKLLELQKTLNFSEDDLEKLANRIVMSVIMRKEILPDDVRRSIRYKMMEVKEVIIYSSIRNIYEEGAQKLE